MTVDVLERLRYYLKETGRASRVAAQNSELNGYKAVALKHQNEAAEADFLLRELSAESGC
jgi:hypothetical protein